MRSENMQQTVTVGSVDQFTVVERYFSSLTYDKTKLCVAWQQRI